MRSTRILALALLVASIVSATSCGSKKTTSEAAQSPFVSVQDGKFVRDGQPYYYIGTNFWYGPILASDGRGGDRERLTRELDSLKALGIENLRVLVGADGPDGVFSRIEPTLQKEPGVYNDTLLVGLDRFLVELGQRDMQAVLYLNNSWEWSGGYGVYLEWAGRGKALIPAIDGYWPFMQQMAAFATDDKAHELFYNHVRAIVSRVNSITGKPYSEDPAIFSWQIGNEPRCFSRDPEVQDAFVRWLSEAAHIIKSIDPNHMVSVGSEGEWGCENSIELFERIHESPDIDYLTAHIWPFNWSWVPKDLPETGIDDAISKTSDYLDMHIEVAGKLSKPLVIEEFGFPRDGMATAPGTAVTGRDTYYKYLFGRVIESSKAGGLFAGVNFWGWSGSARPVHEQWERGDDYCGDPAQEAQGLNGVYDCDPTLTVISESIAQIKR